MTTIHYPAKGYSSLKRQQLLTTAYALEDTRDRALDGLKKAQAAIDAVEALHKPVRRFTSVDGDRSFEFANDAAEWFDVPDEQVTFFAVCDHCGDIEIDDDPDRDYRESLWPCKTRRRMDEVREAFESARFRDSSDYVYDGPLFDSHGDPICTCTVAASCGHHPAEENRQP